MVSDTAERPWVLLFATFPSLSPREGKETFQALGQREGYLDSSSACTFRRCALRNLLHQGRRVRKRGLFGCQEQRQPMANSLNKFVWETFKFSFALECLQHIFKNLQHNQCNIISILVQTTIRGLVRHPILKLKYHGGQLIFKSGRQ